MTAAIAIIAVLGLVAFGWAAIVRADRAGAAGVRAEKAITERVSHERDDLAERVVELEEGIVRARALAQANQVASVKEAQKEIDRVLRQANEGTASAAVRDARARIADRRAGRVPAVPAEVVPELPAATPGPDR